MAEYKDIVGTTVRVNAGDLSGAKTGELFYDKTNSDFKYKHPNTTSSGAWRTGGNMNTARYQLGAAGTQTSALAFGGLTTARVAITESYNGGTWTEVSDLNQGRTGKSMRRDSAISRIEKTIAAHEAGVELTTKILEDKKLSKTSEEIEWFYLDLSCKFNHCYKIFSWIRHCNSSFSFWR